jgi:hypothetical protein
MGDHSSRTILTDGLKQPTRAVSAETSLADLAIRAPPLFGLAPGGVYRAVRRYRGRGALLPHPFTFHAAEAQALKANVTYSLLHCP